MAVPQSSLPMIKREDTWAIIIALFFVVAASIAYFVGGFGLFKAMNVSIATWSTDFGKVAQDLGKNFGGLVILYVFFAVAFTIGAKVMGYDTGKFVAGFTVLYIVTVIVTVLGSWTVMKALQMETPVLALILGMLVANVVKLPAWFNEALRTEFYIKTGIIMLGATLPFTIILQAGPLAILQATIVSVVTFCSIFIAATRLFGLDPRFGACLGAGGSICGVSGAIAVGGSCRAEKEHVSIAISLVVIWAIIMVILLPIWSRALGMAPGPAGAWIGTSEFADAAGFAAASAIGDERAIKTFTLMKVVGRDMFIGVWSLVVAILSVTVWERKSLAQAERVDTGEVWRRFPKFVIGFFVASIFATLVIAAVDPKVGAAYAKDALGAIKTVRGWVFTWAFVCIGFTTRFKELTSFGWKPLAAFTIGVLINVPLGYWLSNILLGGYWMSIK